MSFRRYISTVLATTLLGLAALAVVAQDATPTTDPAMPTTDPMAMATTDPMGGQGAMGDSAMAPIMDASGAQIGWASFTNSMGMTAGMSMDMSTPMATDTSSTTDMTMTGSGKVLVTVQLQSATLAPGFHGMHMHDMGSCGDTGEGPFTAAGKHVAMTGPQHPMHNGDFPVILVNADGTGYVSFETDRFTVADLLDADGSAIIIHANPDNYANIPERYGVPDAETLDAGDSGPRIACGVVQAGMAGAMGTTGMTGATGTDTTGAGGTGTTGTGTDTTGAGGTGTTGTSTDTTATGGTGTTASGTDATATGGTGIGTDTGLPTVDPALVPTVDPALVPTVDPALVPSVVPTTAG